MCNFYTLAKLTGVLLFVLSVAHCNRLSAPTGDAATGLEVEQFDRIYSVRLCFLRGNF